MKLPEKIIMIGGTKRSGTSLMRRLTGSHSEIAIPKSEFNFFHWFGNKSFDTPDDFMKNLDFFFTKCRKSEAWGLEPGMIHEEGLSDRDLYCILLDSYRRHYKPDARYYGDKTTYMEFDYDRYAAWFGVERIKFIHMIRNPFDCFASLKYQSPGNRESGRLIYDFCRDWSRSIMMALARSQQYPRNYCTIRFEDLIEASNQICLFLCDWLGIAPEIDDMLAMTSYKLKVNSSFAGETGNAGTETSGNANIHQLGSRMKHLTKREIDIINSMYAMNIVNMMGYNTSGSTVDNSKGLFTLNSIYLNNLSYGDSLKAHVYNISLSTIDLGKKMLTGITDKFCRSRKN